MILPWAKGHHQQLQDPCIFCLVCRGVWNPPFSYSTLYIKPHFLQKQTYPLFCRSCFSKINMIQMYTTSLHTTIFLTSKSYGGIKLVWIWVISTWFKLFKYINLTQNKIIIFALMHNIWTHPFYFWYTLYTQTPFLTVKPINPPFYPLSKLFKPTLSKVWVAYYVKQEFFFCFLHQNTLRTRIQRCHSLKISWKLMFWYPFVQVKLCKISWNQKNFLKSDISEFIGLAKTRKEILLPCFPNYSADWFMDPFHKYSLTRSGWLMSETGT